MNVDGYKTEGVVRWCKWPFSMAQDRPLSRDRWLSPLRTVHFRSDSFIGENIQIVMLKKFCHGQNVTNGGIELQQKLNAWSQKNFQLISSIVEILNFGKIIKPWSTSGNHILINRILTLKQFHQSSIHRTNPKMLRNTGCKYFDNLLLNKSGLKWTFLKVDGRTKVDSSSKTGRSWAKLNGHLHQSGRSWRHLQFFGPSTFIP